MKTIGKITVMIIASLIAGILVIGVCVLFKLSEFQVGFWTGMVMGIVYCETGNLIKNHEQRQETIR